MLFQLIVALLLAGVVSAKCFEPTIAHPLPDYELDDKLLKSAFTEINAAITSAISASEYSSTSFSIEITSSKETLWSRHHTADKRNASRPDIPEVNGNALYRIASITKTFTVLGILYQEKAGNLSLDDPVNRYITELKDPQNGTLPWKDITLRSLASQLSGIPRECAIPHKPWPLGWQGCQKLQDLLDAVKSQIPILAPNQQSTYSNVAFELLGVVLERVSGKDYQSYIADEILKFLDMSKSTLSTPPDNAGVIPLGDHYWDVDEGIQSPTGGIYSSSTDLSKYLRYVLSKYNGLTHALNWFNPVSSSRGPYSFYGMPWEIYHTDRVLEGSRRTVRFITKGGGLPGYTSIIIVAPEYDLGFTILVAGNHKLLLKLQNIVTGFVRPAEKFAVRQLQDRYTGTYVSSTPGLNSSVTLLADDRGLVVTQLISNSSDMLNSGPLSDWIPQHGFAQLVPTLLYRNAQDQTGEEWRLQPVEDRLHEEREIWDDYCITDIEGPLYAAVPINNFVFWEQDKDGKFQTLELSAFRVNLTRVTEKEPAGEENVEL